MRRNMIRFLKSTGQAVYLLESENAPVRQGYTRILIPYTDREMEQRRTHKRLRAHIAIVRTSRLSTDPV